MYKTKEDHLQALRMLLRYLEGNQTHSLPYRPPDSALHHLLTVYSDSDFANATNQKSITGTSHLIANNPNSREYGKENNDALSTTEFEYIAAT